MTFLLACSPANSTTTIDTNVLYIIYIISQFKTIALYSMSGECHSIKIIAQFQIYVWVLDDSNGLSRLKQQVCTESQRSVRPQSAQ